MNISLLLFVAFFAVIICLLPLNFNNDFDDAIWFYTLHEKNISLS